MDMCRGWKSGYTGHRMLKTELAGRRKMGRLQGKFMDVVKKGMQRVAVTKEDARDRLDADDLQKKEKNNNKKNNV